MAKTLRQIQLDRRRQFVSNQTTSFIAMMGDRTGQLSADGNRVTVRDLISGQDFTVKNTSVPNVPGRLVEVEMISGILQIKDYWGIYGEEDTEARVQDHGDDHRFPNPDMVSIESAQIVAFNVWPSSGFEVQIYGGVFKKEDTTTWLLSNQIVDLSSSQPATGARYALLDYNEDDTITVTDGTPVAALDVLTLADIPAQSNRSFMAIQLYAGQTEIRRDSIRNDFVDLRSGNKNLPQSDIDMYMFGFVADYAGTQETTISFDDSTYIFTLAPTGSDWHYYRNGIKYTITGSKTVTLSGTPPTKGHYYIVIDAIDGTLSASTNPWTLEDTKVPVATIEWDNALAPKYWMSDERHTCAIDRRFHWEHHFSDGSEIIQFPALTGYTVQDPSPVDTDNTFAISETIFSDEDLKHILAALPDGDGVYSSYIIDFRVAASEWDWESSEVPFRYTPAGYIEYDNAGSMTEGQNNKFYNSYLLVTNRDGSAQYTLIPGQAEHSTRLAAEAEQFGDLTLTGISVDEFVAVYQLIFKSSAGYGTLGKCRLEAEPITIEISASGAGAPGATTWGNIVGDISNQTDMIAVNIPITDAGAYFTGTEVETALQELGAGTGGGIEPKQRSWFL